jgi:methionyl-tRNA formyltransferase
MTVRRLRAVYLGNHIPTLKILATDERIDLRGIIVEKKRLTPDLVTYSQIKRRTLVSLQKKQHLLASLEDFGAIDLIAVCSFGWILEDVHINYPRVGTVNIHYSYLPFFRGRHPISRAIQHCAEWTGITLHYVDRGIDTGPILARRKFYLDPLTNDQAAYDQLTALLPDLLDEAVTKLIFKPDKVLNVEESGSYFPPIEYEKECHIRWKKTAVDIYNLIRSQTRFKGAFSIIAGERISFAEARIVETGNYCNVMISKGPAGTILRRLSSNEIAVYVDSTHSILTKSRESLPDVAVSGEVLG